MLQSPEDKVKHMQKESKDSPQKKIRAEEIDKRLEYVKIITRTKASVCNWDDLEKQIMKGAI